MVKLLFLFLILIAGNAWAAEPTKPLVIIQPPYNADGTPLEDYKSSQVDITSEDTSGNRSLPYRVFIPGDRITIKSDSPITMRGTVKGNVVVK